MLKVWENKERCFNIESLEKLEKFIEGMDLSMATVDCDPQTYRAYDETGKLVYQRLGGVELRKIGAQNREAERLLNQASSYIAGTCAKPEVCAWDRLLIYCPRDAIARRLAQLIAKAAAA
jgi:hypothetical protein